MVVFDLENETRNQHFLSQAEQRLNAKNPAAQPENQRIFEFDVVDRDKPVLRLRSPQGRAIGRSLSWQDLFSFDVAASARSNLEALFQNYERDIARVSYSLVEKLSNAATGDDVKGDLLDLFAAKLLNFLRNPYSVRKVLNSIGVVADHLPTDPELRRAHELVKNGSKPQREAVCEQFGLTAELYDRWLVALFNLLVPAPAHHLSLFEALIKRLFESCTVFVDVQAYTATVGSENVCLLSDRAFNSRLAERWGDALEFNVSSRAFACFTFCDPVKHPAATSRPDWAPRLRSHVTVSFSRDDLAALVRYNQLAVYQCAQTVFAAHAQPRLHE